MVEILTRTEQVNALKIWRDEHTLFPTICIGMKCEALTRRGARCRNDGTQYGNGRCKFHGGASTGPKTAEGRRKSSENWKKRWQTSPKVGATTTFE